MPRNKSEKLPTCPEAHVYADACEEVLKGADPSLVLAAWRCLQASTVAKAINMHAQVDSINWRRRRITFIRETYGA